VNANLYSGTNGVFGEHGTVELHWRESQMLSDFCILDLKALLYRLA
jgi:hypothetical protein